MGEGGAVPLWFGGVRFQHSSAKFVGKQITYAYSDLLITMIRILDLVEYGYIRSEAHQTLSGPVEPESTVANKVEYNSAP